MTIKHFMSFILVAAFVAGCTTKKTIPDESVGEKEIVEVKTAKTKEEKAEPKKEEEAIKYLSAAHILIMHTDSEGTSPLIKRTKEEAKALADKLTLELKGGAEFAKLAQDNSDCPSKAHGGDLGSFKPADMAEAFSKAVDEAKVGEITGPVETPYGYHIIKRQKAEPPETLAASIILVLHKDSMPNPIAAKRTKEEAKKRIEEALAKLKAGEDFKKIAEAYSEHPSKAHGGHMGNFTSMDRSPDIVKLIKGLEMGKFAEEILATPLGYHIYMRRPVLESIDLAAGMIVVSYKDAKPNFGKATRTKEEAFKRAEEVIEKLKAGGDFVELAKEYSDHPSKVAGGNIGLFKSDKARPEVTEAVGALEVGEYSSAPMEMSSGFHVWYRRSLEEGKKPMQVREAPQPISP